MPAKPTKTTGENSLIYRFIAGMSKTEKRDFKLYAGKYAKQGGNIYVKMFDAITAATRKKAADSLITDREVKAEIHDSKLLPYFNSAKSKLKAILFDYLYEQKDDTTTETQIFKALRLSEILYDKGFRAEGEKLLSKAIADAQREEYFALELKAIDLLLNRSTVDDLTALNTLTQLHTQAENALLKLGNFMHHSYVHQVVFNQYTGTVQKQKKPVGHTPQREDLVLDLANAKSVSARYLALNALIFFFHRRQDFDAALNYSRQQVELLEKTLPHTQRFMPDYFIASQNYLAILNKYLRHHELEQGIKNYEAKAETYLTLKHEPARSYALASADMLWIALYISKNDLTNTLKFSQRAAHRFQALAKHLTIAKKTVLISFIKQGFFVCKKYKEALHWIDVFKKQAVPGVEEQRKVANLLTQLIILYETNATLNALKSCAASLRYAVKQTVNNTAHAELTLYLIKEIENLVAARNTEEQASVLNRLLQHHEQQLPINDVYLRALINESGYITWLKDKAAKR